MHDQDYFLKLDDDSTANKNKTDLQVQSDDWFSRMANADFQSKLKIEINNLIWMFAHPAITLNEADNLSLEIYELINKTGEDK